MSSVGWYSSTSWTSPTMVSARADSERATNVCTDGRFSPGEPPRAALMANHITDNKHFFVRNHGGIPTVADEDFTLDVSGLIGRPGTLTLAQLQDEKLFPQVEMTISQQCSGTRRVEQIALYAGEGDELLSAPWAEGAIGTAVWKGVQLKKVLKYFGGVTDVNAHVEFIGADTYFKKNDVFNCQYPSRAMLWYCS